MRTRKILASVLMSVATVTTAAVSMIGIAAAQTPSNSNVSNGSNALTDFRAFSHDLSTLSGPFVQEVRDKNGKLKRTSSGTFWLQRPGKFRFVYDKPYKQIIVSDGKTVWIHDEDLNQVTIKKIGDTLGEQPLALLLDPTATDKHFDLKLGEANGAVGYIEAKSKKADAAVSDLRMSFVAKAPKELVWRDGLQNQNTLRFDELVKNKTFAADLFTFTVPKGADVLKQ